jgi:hypothetical protein
MKKATERLISVKLLESTKKKAELVKAYLQNSDDLLTQKIGKSDYNYIKNLVDADFERLKLEMIQNIATDNE